LTTANRLALAAALSAFGLAACTDWAGYDIDVASGKVPQLANMRRSVIPDPYAMPRLPAPGAVPSESPMGATPAHFTSEKLDSVAATLRNPYSGGAPASVLAHGETVFHNNCFVCHGPEGAGNGPVVQPAQGANGQSYSRFPGAPAINGQVTAAKSDGYIYAVVTAGRGLMPPYGPRITEADRWAVVEFLQKGLPYREIHRLTGVSVTTIGRVARFVVTGNGGYQIASQRIAGHSKRNGEDSRRPEVSRHG